MTTDNRPLPESKWLRAYGRDLSVMLAAYAAVLVASILLRGRASGLLRYLVAIAPAVPFAALGWVLLRMLQRVDERERLLVYRAISFAFVGTAVVSLGYGFAETAGSPPLSMFAVWPVMATLWILGKFIAPRLP